MNLKQVSAYYNSLSSSVNHEEASNVLDFSILENITKQILISLNNKQNEKIIIDKDKLYLLQKTFSFYSEKIFSSAESFFKDKHQSDSTLNSQQFKDSEMELKNKYHFIFNLFLLLHSLEKTPYEDIAHHFSKQKWSELSESESFILDNLNLIDFNNLPTFNLDLLKASVVDEIIHFDFNLKHSDNCLFNCLKSIIVDKIQKQQVLTSNKLNLKQFEKHLPFGAINLISNEYKIKKSKCAEILRYYLEKIPTSKFYPLLTKNLEKNKHVDICADENLMELLSVFISSNNTEDLLSVEEEQVYLFIKNTLLFSLKEEICSSFYFCNLPNILSVHLEDLSKYNQNVSKDKIFSKLFFDFDFLSKFKEFLEFEYNKPDLQSDSLYLTLKECLLDLIFEFNFDFYLKNLSNATMKFYIPTEPLLEYNHLKVNGLASSTQSKNIDKVEKILKLLENQPLNRIFTQNTLWFCLSRQDDLFSEEAVKIILTKLESHLNDKPMITEVVAALLYVNAECNCKERLASVLILDFLYSKLTQPYFFEVLNEIFIEDENCDYYLTQLFCVINKYVSNNEDHKYLINKNTNFLFDFFQQLKNID